MIFEDDVEVRPRAAASSSSEPQSPTTKALSRVRNELLLNVDVNALSQDELDQQLEPAPVALLPFFKHLNYQAQR